MQERPRKVLFGHAVLTAAGLTVAVTAAAWFLGADRCTDMASNCTEHTLSAAPSERVTRHNGASPSSQALRVNPTQPAGLAQLDALAGAELGVVDPDDAEGVVFADEVDSMEGEPPADDNDGDDGTADTAGDTGAAEDAAPDGAQNGESEADADAESDQNADSASSSATEQAEVQTSVGSVAQTEPELTGLAVSGSAGETISALQTAQFPSQPAGNRSLETWLWPWPGTQNHSETVNRVSCDAHDAVRINQASQLFLLGDPAIRIFCLAPGDYSTATLSAIDGVSGSANLPRVVQLDSDALDIALGVAEAADTALATLPPLTLLDSDHWHFVGVRWATVDASPLSLLRSDGVLMDRVRIAMGGVGVSVSESDNFRLQRSLVTAAESSDTLCVSVALRDDDVLAVTNAEFRGCQHGLQVSAPDAEQWADVIVAGNEFHRNAGLAVACDQAGVWIDGSGALAIDDNQFSGWGASTGCEDPVGAAVVLDAGAEGVALARNLIWQSEVGVVIQDGAGAVSVHDTVIVGDGSSDGLRVGAGAGEVELGNNHIVDTARWLDSQRSALTVSCNAIASSGYASVVVGSDTVVSLNSYFDALPGTLGAPLGLDQVAVLGADDFGPICFATGVLSAPQNFCLSGAARNPASVDCGSDHWVN